MKNNVQILDKKISYIEKLIEIENYVDVTYNEGNSVEDIVKSLKKNYKNYDIGFVEFDEFSIINVTLKSEGPRVIYPKLKITIENEVVKTNIQELEDILEKTKSLITD